MSKTITIPSDRGSRVFVTINGKDYVYKAGITVSVPDEVAALFEANAYEAVTGVRRATAPLEAPERKGDKIGVPILVDDEGNLYADVDEAGKAILGEIYVEGHKAIIPSEE